MSLLLKSQQFRAKGEIEHSNLGKKRLREFGDRKPSLSQGHRTSSGGIPLTSGNHRSRSGDHDSRTEALSLGNIKALVA